MKRLGFLGLLALTASAGLAGCNRYVEGGNGSSEDTFTYVSTSEQPKTITMVDWRDGTVIWTYEVPVGRKVVISFVADRFESPNRPDLMRWGEMSTLISYGELKNEMAVPKTRRVDVALREAGESAPGAKTKPAGTASARPRGDFSN